MYYGPPLITTPKIEEDIYSFFGEGIDKEFFYEKYLEVSKRESILSKLQLLVERYEFIDHLLLFKRMLVEQKTIREIKDIANNQIQRIESIEFHGKEFDGVDYDIESLVIYLFLTCIDTICGKSKGEYLSQGDWLIKYWSRCSDSETPVEFIKRTDEEYKKEYGIGKNFKNVLNEELSLSLQNRLISNYAIVKLLDGNIDEISMKNWLNLSEKQKLKKIVDELFRIRNEFTHTSYRTFVPRIPVTYLKATEDKVLISVVSSNVDSLILIFKDIVIDLIRKKLLGL